MNDPVSPNACTRCGAALSATAKFCAQCGAPLPGAAQNKWYHHWLFVLFMLFFVLGPFGLPLVWKNPKLSRPVQWILTVSVLIYTALLIQLTMNLVHAVTQAMNQFNSSLQPY